MYECDAFQMRSAYYRMPLPTYSGLGMGFSHPNARSLAAFDERIVRTTTRATR